MHRNTERSSLWILLGGCFLALGVVGASVGAEEIRLTNGKKFSGIILGKDAESLIIKLPRDRVATINGKRLPAPVKVGSMAPAFTAVDLDGTTHTVAEASGQPVLLQFWASWCPHCRSDLGLMKTLAARYQDQGLRVLTVSIDRDLDALRALIASERLAYPVIPVTGPSVSSEQAALPDRYEMQGVPAYYLIDAKGRIAKTLSGSVSEGRADLEGTVQGLLTTNVRSTAATP